MSFCAYSFLLDPIAKRKVLAFEAALQMTAQMRSAISLMFLTQESPYLVLQVRRSHLIHDTLTQLASMPPQAYKKPIKIIFVGEEAVDAGGVAKEFFQLVVNGIFDVNYGMFTYQEVTRDFWFHPATALPETQLDREYQLIGILLGLAIYNSHILDVHLPLPIYKKLLAWPVGLDDLALVSPSLAQGLSSLLAYEGDDVEDVFCLTFEATYEAFGEFRHVELVPEGAKRPVTSNNKDEYVRAYVDW